MCVRETSRHHDGVDTNDRTTPPHTTDLIDLFRRCVAEDAGLDGVVRAAKEAEAREINCDGLAAQIEYLVTVHGAEWVREEILLLAEQPTLGSSD